MAVGHPTVHDHCATPRLLRETHWLRRYVASDDARQQVNETRRHDALARRPQRLNVPPPVFAQRLSLGSTQVLQGDGGRRDLGEIVAIVGLHQLAGPAEYRLAERDPGPYSIPVMPVSSHNSRRAAAA